MSFWACLQITKVGSSVALKTATIYDWGGGGVSNSKVSKTNPWRVKSHFYKNSIKVKQKNKQGRDIHGSLFS